MKILWLTNIPLPDISQKLGLDNYISGGWIVALAENLLKSSDIELISVFPQSKQKSMLSGEINNIKYYGFFSEQCDWTNYNKHMEEQFRSLILECQPDLVHVFGTEYPHSLCMIKAFNNPNKTLIYIQGLSHIIAEQYCSGIPYKIIKRRTLKDIIRKTSIIDEQKKYIIRGQAEKEAFRLANQIMGRTDWDKACTLQLNPNANYHFANEILREQFYLRKWNVNDFEKYSIFVSQAFYPIKGLHFLIEALSIVVKQFPETKLYIAGQNIMKENSFHNNIRLTSYEKYIKDLVEKYKLQNNIIALGALNENEMCNALSKVNVFVLPSSIENSPNSLGEAMLMGVPSVCSNVGGVSNLMVHNEDGFLYQYDAPYMLAYYICKLFTDKELMSKFSESSKKRSKILFDKQINLNAVVEIYRSILNNRGEQVE